MFVRQTYEFVTDSQPAEVVLNEFLDTVGMCEQIHTVVDGSGNHRVKVYLKFDRSQVPADVLTKIDAMAKHKV